MPFQLRGKYFEELPEGTEFFTPGRTVTEADVVTFASFSGAIFGRHSMLALNALNHGSATAGNCDRSWMSMGKIAVRFLLEPLKHTTSGWMSAKMDSIVLSKLLSFIAAFPASTCHSALRKSRIKYAANFPGTPLLFYSIRWYEN